MEKKIFTYDENFHRWLNKTEKFPVISSMLLDNNYYHWILVKDGWSARVYWYSCMLKNMEIAGLIGSSLSFSDYGHYTTATWQIDYRPSHDFESLKIVHFAYQNKSMP